MNWISSTLKAFGRIFKQQPQRAYCVAFSNNSLPVPEEKERLNFKRVQKVTFLTNDPSVDRIRVFLWLTK